MESDQFIFLQFFARGYRRILFEGIYKILAAYKYTWVFIAFWMRRDMYGTDWKYLDDDRSVSAAAIVQEYRFTQMMERHRMEQS